MSGTEQVRVSRVAAWAGWCSPCGSGDRPLVLTRTGPSGLRAWLAGHGDDDRVLLLTCNVCGQSQVVPPHEADDPEVVLVEDDALSPVHQVAVAAPAVPSRPAAHEVPTPAAAAAAPEDLVLDLTDLDALLALLPVQTAPETSGTPVR